MEIRFLNSNDVAEWRRLGPGGSAKYRPTKVVAPTHLSTPLRGPLSTTPAAGLLAAPGTCVVTFAYLVANPVGREAVRVPGGGQALPPHASSGPLGG